MKRCSDRIRNENLADSLFKDGGNIFQEVKKLRGGSKTFSSRIDDKVSPHDMVDHFATMYNSLYNKVNLSDDFQIIKDKILSNVNYESQEKYNRRVLFVKQLIYWNLKRIM